MVNTVRLGYVVAALVGVLALGLGLAALYERRRLTPAYTDVLWDFGEINVLDFSLGTTLGKVVDGTFATGASLAQGLGAGSVGSVLGSLGGYGQTTSRPTGDLQRQDVPNLRFVVPVKMWNPNPYVITATPQEPGSGYFLTPEIDIADATPTELKLAASEDRTMYTTGTMDVDVTTHMDSKELMAIVQAMIASGSLPTSVAMFYEYSLDVVVSPTVFWTTMSVTAKATSKCRVEVDLRSASPSAISEPQCGRTWEDLGRRRLAGARRLEYEAPPPSAQELPVDRDTVEEAQAAVDSALLGLAGGSFALSLCCFCGIGAHVAMTSRRPADPQDDEEVAFEDARMAQHPAAAPQYPMAAPPPHMSYPPQARAPSQASGPPLPMARNQVSATE